MLQQFACSLRIKRALFFLASIHHLFLAGKIFTMPGSTSPHQFPMERVLYNLHHKCCTYALQRTSRRSRSWAEHSILVTAVCSFGALLLAHMTFVHRLNAAVHNNDHPTTIPTTCLSSIPGFVKDSDLTHIILHADDSTLLSRVTASPPSRQPRRIEEKEQPEERNPTVCAEEQSEENANNEHTTCDTFPATFLGSPSSSSSAWRWEDEILFSYSLEKGYLLLSQDLCERHGINVQYVQVSKRDANCFGEPFLQWLVFSILGHDTVIINWLLGTYNHVNNGSGYIYNPRTRVMTDLSQYHHETSTTTNSKSSLAQWAILRMTEELALKTVVVIKTSFLFFILTTLVSFTLRETQGRMLDFTHHLQEYVRANRSVASLVMTHVVENLVFVPIMVGMIFFLIEFYRGDKLLAFMVLSLVWVCESFSVVRCVLIPAGQTTPFNVYSLLCLASLHTACARSKASTSFQGYSSCCSLYFIFITFRFLGGFRTRLWQPPCALCCTRCSSFGTATSFPPSSMDVCD